MAMTLETEGFCKRNIFANKSVFEKDEKTPQAIFLNFLVEIEGFFVRKKSRKK